MEAHCYRFLRSIDEGAYGAVHACLGPNNALVAVKSSKYWEDPQCKRLLLREIRVLRTLPSHPCVIALVDAFRSHVSGRPHLVFEFMERSLHQELEGLNGYRMEPDILKTIAWQLALGLAHCHCHKVIHRDVKPANVLLSGQGCHTSAKICDFGFARFVESEGPDAHEPLSSYVVTRWYRAPEVIVRDEYGTQSDVWSLGCTLAEVATGAPLFPGASSLNQLARIMRCFGPLPPRLTKCLTADRELAVLCDPARCPRSRTLTERLQDVDPRLQDVVAACLTLDPSRRPSARDVLQMPFFHDVPRLLAATSLRGLLLLSHDQRQRQQQGAGRSPRLLQQARWRPDAAAAHATAPAQSIGQDGALRQRPITRCGESMPDLLSASARAHEAQTRQEAKAEAAAAGGPAGRRSETAVASFARRAGSGGSDRYGVAGSARARGHATSAAHFAEEGRGGNSAGNAATGERLQEHSSEAQEPEEAAVAPAMLASRNAPPLSHAQSNVTELPARQSTDLSLSGVHGISAPALLAKALASGATAEGGGGVGSSGGGGSRPASHSKSHLQPNAHRGSFRSYHLSLPTKAHASDISPPQQVCGPFPARVEPWAGGSRAAPAADGAPATGSARQPGAEDDAPGLNTSGAVDIPQKRCSTFGGLGAGFHKPHDNAHSVLSSGGAGSFASAAERDLDGRYQPEESRPLGQSIGSRRESSCSFPLEVAVTSPMGLPEPHHAAPHDKLPHCRGRFARLSNPQLFESGPVGSLQISPARNPTSSSIGASMQDWGQPAANAATHGSAGLPLLANQQQSRSRSATILESMGTETVVAAMPPKTSLSGIPARTASSSALSRVSSRVAWHRAGTGLSRFAMGSCELPDAGGSSGPAQTLPPIGREPPYSRAASLTSVCLHMEPGAAQAAVAADAAAPPPVSAAVVSVRARGGGGSDKSASTEALTRMAPAADGARGMGSAGRGRGDSGGGGVGSVSFWRRALGALASAIACGAQGRPQESA